MDQFFYTILTILNSDTNQNYKAINHEVNSPKEIESIINPVITYGKGSALFRMFNYILGEETFTNGLAVYTFSKLKLDFLFSFILQTKNSII
jgi:aminopeptidase N